MKRLALLALPALLLAGCPTAAPQAADQLVLKAYDVPAEHAAELQGIVSSLLYAGKDQPSRGSAALAPSGQLLVSAPAGFQPGIADVVQRLKSGKVEQAPTIKLDYWIVGGIAAPAPTPGSAVSSEVAGVVDALEKSQGPMKLALLERLQVSTQSGSMGRARGSLYSADQTAALHGDKVVADLDMRGMRSGNGLETRVEMPLDKPVVLGQAGLALGGGASVITDGELSKAAADGTLTAFYIVRATVDGK